MHEPTHLDLFSGIGGFALAARWAGFRTIGFCELEPYRIKNAPRLPMARLRSLCEGYSSSEIIRRMSASVALSVVTPILNRKRSFPS